MLDLKAIFDPDRTLPGDDVVVVAKRSDPKPPAADATRVDDNAEAGTAAAPIGRRLLSSPAARRGDWSADVAAAADFALLLTLGDLPSTPFDFGGPHCIVVDADKFLRWLQADARRGPISPRAMYGALQSDLRRLRGMLETVTRQNG
jgi:hypothetical protein